LPDNRGPVADLRVRPPASKRCPPPLSVTIEGIAVVKPLPRLKLQGFNNLTKALSFNIYDICYAITDEQRQRYIEYIDEAYNAERLT
jgi:hypothetical protein